MTKVKFIKFCLLFALGTATVAFNSYSKDNDETKRNPATNTIDQGVIINGVKWATRNVDNPGTFADKPEDTGMFYQWNRKAAWLATGDITNWDSSIPAGDMWEKANDPSPIGWRVPTLDEIKTLYDSGKVTIEWTAQNGINGRRFTDIATGNSIFLPAAGYLGNSDGTLYSVGSDGYYWSRQQYNKVLAYYLYFSSGDAFWSGCNTRSYGFSVRAVSD